MPVSVGACCPVWIWPWDDLASGRRPCAACLDDTVGRRRSQTKILLLPVRSDLPLARQPQLPERIKHIPRRARAGWSLPAQLQATSTAESRRPSDSDERPSEPDEVTIRSRNKQAEKPPWHTEEVVRPDWSRTDEWHSNNCPRHCQPPRFSTPVFVSFSGGWWRLFVPASTRRPGPVPLS